MGNPLIVTIIIQLFGFSNTFSLSFLIKPLLSYFPKRECKPKFSVQNQPVKACPENVKVNSEKALLSDRISFSFETVVFSPLNHGLPSQGFREWFQSLPKVIPSFSWEKGCELRNYASKNHRPAVIEGYRRRDG